MRFRRPPLRDIPVLPRRSVPLPRRRDRRAPPTTHPCSRCSSGAAAIRRSHGATTRARRSEIRSATESGLNGPVRCAARSIRAPREFYADDRGRSMVTSGRGSVAERVAGLAAAHLRRLAAPVVPRLHETRELRRAARSWQLPIVEKLEFCADVYDAQVSRSVMRLASVHPSAISTPGSTAKVGRVSIRPACLHATSSRCGVP